MDVSISRSTSFCCGEPRQSKAFLFTTTRPRRQALRGLKGSRSLVTHSLHALCFPHHNISKTRIAIKIQMVRKCCLLIDEISKMISKQQKSKTRKIHRTDQKQSKEPTVFRMQNPDTMKNQTQRHYIRTQISKT